MQTIDNTLTSRVTIAPMAELAPTLAAGTAGAFGRNLAVWDFVFSIEASVAGEAGPQPG